MKERGSSRRKDDRAALPSEEVPIAVRTRDLEDDVFDVAHNSMLRHAMPSLVHRTSSSSTPESRPPVQEAPRKLMLDDDGNATSSAYALRALTDAEQLRISEIQAAVDATWTKANEMQGQAIDAAVRSAVHHERERLEMEHKRQLEKLAEERKLEVEQVKRHTWQCSYKDRDRAVAEALQAQANELEQAKQDMVDLRERTAAELATAYQKLKEEAAEAVRLEHASNITSAVQHTWDKANRQQEVAVAAARAAGAEEARKEAEDRFAAERVELKAEHRRALQSKGEAQAEMGRSERAELKALRDEISALRTAARDAEAKAAAEQQKAVLQAVRAAEEIARKASLERQHPGASAAERAGLTVRQVSGGRPVVRVQLSVSSSRMELVADSALNALAVPGEPMPAPPQCDLASEWDD